MGGGRGNEVLIFFFLNLVLVIIRSRNKFIPLDILLVNNNLKTKIADVTAKGISFLFIFYRYFILFL